MDDLDAHRLPTFRRRLTVFRWWMVGGLVLAAVSAQTLLAIDLPWLPLGAALLLLAGYNLVISLRADEANGSPGALAGQLLVDLAALGVLLFLSGGATNPLISLLLLPVAFAALSLPLPWTAGVAAVAIGLYSLLMLYSLPLPVADAQRAAQLHLGGMWLTFVVSAALVAWFVTRMTAAIRERDAWLATAREEGLRDAQVVALGQLAAGAAHELGTPLATMNVLAGELMRDERLPADARDDLRLLCGQIAQCKETVGGLTRQAGIERPVTLTAADDWLKGLLARWQSLWPEASCVLAMTGSGVAPHIAIDAAVEQAIMNLLNNAARVAPQDMRLALGWGKGLLSIAVHDCGPGFPPEVLRGAGAEPVMAAQGGSGIGLWLTRAAIERRGGRLKLDNTETGGVAAIELPLEGKT